MPRRDPHALTAALAPLAVLAPLAALAGCLKDPPVTPAATEAALDLRIAAQVAGESEEVQVRVFYRRAAGEVLEEIDLLQRSIRLEPGGTQRLELVVNLSPCLSDPLRTGADEQPGRCDLSVEVRLVADGGAELDRVTVEVQGVGPGAVTEVPDVTLSPEPVVLTPGAVTLHSLGETFTLEATSFAGGSARDATFTFGSLDEEIVLVSQAGELLALSNGTTHVVATDDRGHADSALVTVEQRPALIQVFAGSEQEAMVGTEVEVAPLVHVMDAMENAIAGQPVSFAITRGGGTVTTPAATTNANGVASSDGWVLGPTPTLNRITATAGDVSAEIDAVGTPLPVFLGTGTSHSCATDANGTGFCWGDNFRGQTGDGSTGGVRRTPVFVSFDNGFSLLGRAGGRHTCGIALDGATYCWGEAFQGQVGLGAEPPTAVSSPEPVDGEHAFAVVATGRLHSCALSGSGVAWCWGNNQRGGLGDGTQEIRYSPTPVMTALRFRAISAGWQHSCGIATDDKAYCWGGNTYGQLGDGTTVDRLNPFPVTGDHTFDVISAGSDHTCGITTEGATLCWGRNLGGQLGDGTTTDRLTPTPVAGGHDFTAISAGSSLTHQLENENFTCALTAEGEAYCWGLNEAGQLGDGTTSPRLVPTRVAGAYTFSVIGAGSHHACGVRMDGQVFCWGSNELGQIGDGTTSPRPTPVPIAEPTFNPQFHDSRQRDQTAPRSPLR